MIRAGDLDRQVQLVRATAGIPDEFNESTSTWAAFATVMAKYQPMSGREFFAAAEIMNERRALFTIRWRSDIKFTDRVQFGSDQWLIASMREIGRHEGLELQVYIRGTP